MDIKKIGFAIAVIAMAILGAGCIESPNSDISQTVTSEPIPQPERNDNAIFIILVEEMGYDISRYLNDLGTCVSDGDYMDGHIAAIRLESLADVYIEDINECIVTGDMRETQALVIASLGEIKLGAQDCQAALPMMGTNADGVGLLKGLGHFEIAVEYLEAIK